MTPEELQPYFNICPNGGALPRILGKLPGDEYDLLVDRIQSVVELAYANGQQSERERCAAVADSFRTTPADYADWSPLPAADDRARRIAATIRAIPD